MKILAALIVTIVAIGTASADLGGAQAAMSAAASQLGSTGADVIGGYGGSSSGSSAGGQSAAASTNANLGFILSTQAGQVSMPSMSDIEARISSDLGQVTGSADTPISAPGASAADAISSNLGHIASEPSSGRSEPSMADVHASISGNLGSLSGGISSGAAGSSSPSIGSPCAGVMTSSVPASAVTYAAVHGA